MRFVQVGRGGDGRAEGRAGVIQEGDAQGCAKDEDADEHQEESGAPLGVGVTGNWGRDHRTNTPKHTPGFFRQKMGFYLGVGLREGVIKRK